MDDKIVSDILFSGGLPASQRVQTRSEASLMRDCFLTKLRYGYSGPPNLRMPQPARVHLEERSYQTYGNVRLTLKMLRDGIGLDNIESIGVVTHDEHYARFLLTFEAYGFTRIEQVSVPCLLSNEEAEAEKKFLRMHQLDPKGIVFGRLHDLSIDLRKITGGGR